MIQWENNENPLPIKSWCADADAITLEQATNLANHSALRGHVALMPDAHAGYGMPIGGVIACENALIPNAVGVDIGCGMAALKTTLRAGDFTDKAHLRSLMDAVKARIPVGEGHARKNPVEWAGFDEWLDGVGGTPPGWWSDAGHKLDQCNLGTLGGGNHFIEIQYAVTDKGDGTLSGISACDPDAEVWVMLHSGSRNMGQRVASFYHKAAQALDGDLGLVIPNPHLAYLPADHDLGKAYIRDMNHALRYALENRRLMLDQVRAALAGFFPALDFTDEINIHHNYAALETHGDAAYWVHRKGATSARKGEIGLIPGSMGTASYIVEGLGNEASFQSCSHGAGRCLGRSQANRTLTLEDCNAAMGDVVYDRFGYTRSHGEKHLDLSEAPQAYKDIDAVIAAESDLVTALVKLRPLAVVKG
jgi:tRNA-splicing ligase RtcB